MGLLPDTVKCGLCMRQECRERFHRRRLQRSPLVIDPGMHHGTCVTHVPWCMPGSLARGAGETFLTFPAQMQVAFLRTWQEAHTAARTSPWQVVLYIFNEGEGEKAYIHILIIVGNTTLFEWFDFDFWYRNLVCDVCIQGILIICQSNVNWEGIVFVRTSWLLPPLGRNLKKRGSDGDGICLTRFVSLLHLVWWSCYQKDFIIVCVMCEIHSPRAIRHTKKHSGFAVWFGLCLSRDIYFTHHANQDKIL